MTPALRNLVWFVAFPAVGIVAACLGMGQALGGWLILSVSNRGYCLGRGLLAGLVFGFFALLFWLSNRFSSRRSRAILLAVFGIGWYLIFYSYVAAGAAV